MCIHYVAVQLLSSCTASTTGGRVGTTSHSPAGSYCSNSGVAVTAHYPSVQPCIKELLQHGFGSHSPTYASCARKKGGSGWSAAAGLAGAACSIRLWTAARCTAPTPTAAAAAAARRAGATTVAAAAHTVAGVGGLCTAGAAPPAATHARLGKRAAVR
ncbi:hypothetical protein COO60DRAFT_366664 [Scenedesmus sp. NREL 46B-D3]|nr:hypothetical protein COO60DRAFT_366664 [Scenedesmus sp. NREL 46B-D3]